MARPRSLLAALAGGLAALAALAFWLVAGPGPRWATPRLLAIAPGSSRWDIARQLSGAGVVPSAVGFEAWSLLHRHQTLKAGTYRFTGGQSAATVFGELARGQFFAIVLSVPEGFNRFDLARAVERLGLASQTAFLQATADPSSIRDLDPAAVSLEGYLFPATYRIPPQAGAARIAAMMTGRFRQELRQERRENPDLPTDLHRWITIASLVEKETAIAAERPLIAGVFNNRLARNLPLQCDPTVIYAALLAGRYDGAIHRADLEFASPYNTYLHPGLPPGPIANPGRQSLLAAADPAATNFLYFVSDGAGAHRFARTLAEQQENVRRYLRTLRAEGR